jgi:hypothetical protein
LAAVGVVVMAALTWRQAVGGFWVSDDSVRLSGIVFSRRISWTDVDSFQVKPLGPSPYAAYVVRRDGRAFSSIAVSSSTNDLQSNGWNAVTIVNALNKVHERVRASAS